MQREGAEPGRGFGAEPWARGLGRRSPQSGAWGGAPGPEVWDEARPGAGAEPWARGLERSPRPGV